MGWNKLWFKWNINTHSQTKFKTTILNPSFCDHSDAYIFVKGPILVENTGVAGADANNNDI